MSRISAFIRRDQRASSPIFPLCEVTARSQPAAAQVRALTKTLSCGLQPPEL